MKAQVRLLALIGATLIATACSSEVPMLEVALGAHDYSFSLPDGIPGGAAGTCAEEGRAL